MSRPHVAFTDERLDNGLRVLLAPDDLAPVVAVNLWYDVGSKHEVLGKTGLAHLFEHMMFQGSTNVAKGTHFQLVDGAGGTCNASTWLHRTNYYETGPSSQLPIYLWLEADRMGGLLDALGQETLDNQRDVVKNEKRQRYDDPPYGTAWLRILDNLMPKDHPYHHPTIGSMEDLDSVTVEDCRAFFQAYYAPNNAVLTVAGDFEPDQAREWIQRYFGQIPSHDRPATPSLDMPRHLGATVREELVDRAPLPRIYVAFRAPDVAAPESFATDIAASILSFSGGASVSKSTRLYRTLVREKQIAQDVGCSLQTFAGTSVALAHATALPGVDPAELEQQLLDVIMGVAQDASDEEVATAQAGTERALIQQRFLRAAFRADSLSEFATVTGDPEDMNREIDRYLAVTTEQVRAAAADTFREDNLAVITYVPKEVA